MFGKVQVLPDGSFIIFADDAEKAYNVVSPDVDRYSRYSYDDVQKYIADNPQVVL